MAKERFSHLVYISLMILFVGISLSSAFIFTSGSASAAAHADPCFKSNNAHKFGPIRNMDGDVRQLSDTFKGTNRCKGAIHLVFTTLQRVTTAYVVDIHGFRISPKLTFRHTGERKMLAAPDTLVSGAKFFLVLDGSKGIPPHYTVAGTVYS